MICDDRRRSASAAGGRRSASAKAIAKPIATDDQRQLDVLRAAASCSGRGCRRSSPGRSRCRRRSAARRASGPGAGPGRAARARVSSRRAARRRARTSRSAQRADHLDRQHAGDLAARVDDRPVLRLVCSRSESASRRTSSSSTIGSGRSAARRDALARSARSRASRAAAVGVDQQRVGEVGVGDLGARLGDRLADAHQRGRHRSMSRTRCSASRFSARSAPTKSSTKAFGRVQQQLGGRARTARACRPPAGSRSGRPS